MKHHKASDTALQVLLGDGAQAAVDAAQHTYPLPALRLIDTPSARAQAPSVAAEAVRVRRHLAPVDSNPKVAVDAEYVTFLALSEGASRGVGLADACTVLDKATKVPAGSWWAWAKGLDVPTLHQARQVAEAMRKPLVWFTDPDQVWDWRSVPGLQRTPDGWVLLPRRAASSVS